MTYFPIQSTAQIKWNIVVRLKRYRTRNETRQRGDTKLQIAIGPFIPNRTWKIDILASEGSPLITATEVKWWHQSVISVWEASVALCLFCSILSSFYCIRLQSLYLSMWQWSQKTRSSFESMQHNHDKPKQASSNDLIKV